jgi:hypothetical protein
MSKRYWYAAPGHTIPVPGTSGLPGPVRNIPEDPAEAVAIDDDSPEGRRALRLKARGSLIERIAEIAPKANQRDKAVKTDG